MTTQNTVPPVHATYGLKVCIYQPRMQPNRKLAQLATVLFQIETY